MTNINCCADCIYQQDGKCGYDTVALQSAPSAAVPGAVCPYQRTAASSDGQPGAPH